MLSKRKKTYLNNKSSKVGSICCCPICGKNFTKKQYSQSFCCNDCKVKYHNNRQRGKRNDYFRKYNMKHPERYERVGIDIDYEKWKSNYYFESYANMDEYCVVEINEDDLIRQYELETGNIYKGFR